MRLAWLGRWGSAFVVAMLFGAGVANAQIPHLAELRRQHAHGDNGEQELHQEITDVRVNVPVPLAERSFLIPGLAYHSDEFAFERPDQGRHRLQAVTASLLFVQLFEGGWNLSLRVSGMLAGDLGRANSGMLQGDAAGLVIKTVDEHLAWGVGAVLTNALGTLLPVPAVYLRWTPSSLFRFETFLPGFATATFSFGDRLELNAHAEVGGYNYGMASCTSNRPGNPACRGVEDVLVTNATARLGVNVRLWASLWLEAHLGRSIYRHFREVDRAGNSVSRSPGVLPGGFVAGLGLTFRIPPSAL